MNSPIPTNSCLHCGSPLPADAGANCPRCLLLSAMQPTEPHSATGAAPDISIISAAFPQLEILELIGQGGMGWVFKARQPKLNRLVALKLLPASLAERDPAFAGRFEREGQLLARLHHPNIVAVHDSGRAGEFFYLLMEYVDGVNLRQAMRSSRFTPAQALAIVPHIRDALQFAHEGGVLHRDIKPENILLYGKGRVKLADFGIAKVLAERNDTTQGTDLHDDETSFESSPSFESFQSLTHSGSTLGTPNYMAPEQRDTPSEVDSRADIYSLGVVFYELLTGELPTGALPRPSAKCDADPRVDAIVQQALEKERTRRQHSASEMKTQVTQLNSALTPEEISVVTQIALHRRGFDYKSQRTLCGVPLLHVVSGIDPATGKQRVARGIIALGGRAHGWLAIGGFATGGVAIGGCAIGGIAIGGVAFGGIALGGSAIGLVALGGWALGILGIGGFAVGYFALGGKAVGVHAMDAMNRPSWPSWLLDWVRNAGRPSGAQVGGLVMGLNLAMMALISVPVLVKRWARRKATSQTQAGVIKPPRPLAVPHLRGCLISVFGVALCFLAISHWLFGLVRVNTDSLEPSLPQGSLAVIYKLHPDLHPNDIVAFHRPELNDTFLARVVSADSTRATLKRDDRAVEIVSSDLIEGKVITILWRASPAPMPTGSEMPVPTPFPRVPLPNAFPMPYSPRDRPSPTKTDRTALSDPKPAPADARMQRQILEAQLKSAEEDLSHVESAYKVGLENYTAFLSAESKVAILKAELAGDPAKLDQVKLERAELELTDVEQLRSNGLTGEEAVTQARNKVALHRAELTKDPIKIAEAKVAGAESMLALLMEKVEAGLLHPSELTKAKTELEIRTLELKALRAKTPTPP